MEFKVVLIGDSCVGKSALVHRLEWDRPLQDSQATVGALFSRYILQGEGSGAGAAQSVQIWDTGERESSRDSKRHLSFKRDTDIRELGGRGMRFSGQEKFKSVTTHHYRAAHAALLVFDITSEESFESLDRWLEEVRECTVPETVLVLVGNKADLDEQRCVSSEKAQAYAEQEGMSLFFETSCNWSRTHGEAGESSSSSSREKQKEGEAKEPLVQRGGIETLVRSVVREVEAKKDQFSFPAMLTSKGAPSSGLWGSGSVRQGGANQTVRVDGLSIDTQQLHNYHAEVSGGNSRRCAC
uniref:Uncharacterized protein n=1 Tax=Chromera velia CCMP2878 TaxID=1169474 RepID=A0A0G4FEJ7_9ALVE|eukprot:Cvel_16613.t1-p1 / transcript=Cvel_16613.t1 / gene=Cvel_16613 / organism=Chromera_velia_CCMP2878 / gene_product=Ras-related protein RABA4b, putative / transcript_product=Ras-related protein RABA4b, putative / location=Cvel_scaffold1287:22650-26590(+) / protein_length=296 / sequence_SO=supercontig / SO=protein_coding / is_pseudo=false